MVGRKPRKSKRPEVMGNHNRCWLWGRHVVNETLAAGVWPIIELRLSDDLDPAQRQRIAKLAADRQIPVAFESSSRLRQLCGSADHQGHLARMRPFPFRTLDQLLEHAVGNRVFCVLDGIQDPHNFGAIIRSAEVLGIDGMIVGSTRQSDVTAIVARSSAGAVNHLPLAQSDDLLQTVSKLRGEHGYQIAAATQRGSAPPSTIDWTRPSVLIIGNEAAGVSDDLLQVCDHTVCIPQAGHIESLNAAVAAGILCYEVRRQRSEQHS